MGLTASAKTVDSGQPAQSTQANLDPYFSQPAFFFLSVLGPVYLIIKMVVKRWSFMDP